MWLSIKANAPVCSANYALWFYIIGSGIDNNYIELLSNSYVWKFGHGKE